MERSHTQRKQKIIETKEADSKIIYKMATTGTILTF